MCVRVHMRVGESGAGGRGGGIGGRADDKDSPLPQGSVLIHGDKAG